MLNDERLFAVKIMIKGFHASDPKGFHEYDIAYFVNSDDAFNYAEKLWNRMTRSVRGQGKRIKVISKYHHVFKIFGETKEEARLRIKRELAETPLFANKALAIP